jgi:hypothetical protein
MLFSSARSSRVGPSKVCLPPRPAECNRKSQMPRTRPGEPARLWVTQGSAMWRNASSGTPYERIAP